jgi:hypothetical protein
MVRRLGTILAAIILLAGLSLGFSGVVSAQSPDQTTAIITSPVDGQQLFGLVNISGSAGNQTAFDYFTLEYNDQSDPNAPWNLVQPLVRQQHQNDILGAWNTNMVPDGVYRLRLRVFLADGQVGGEFVVSNLRVINSEPTPVPTIGGLETTLVAPTPGPSPTSPIQQPASSSPSGGGFVGQDTTGGESAPVLPGVQQTSEQRTEKKTRINTERVRGAFCTGVYLTLGLFGIMLVYRLIRGRLRPYTRRLDWQAQDEYDHE